MGQDPDAIRHEVEHTREQMGETIDALGHKADVKGRTKERIGDTVDRREGDGIGMASEQDAQRRAIRSSRAPAAPPAWRRRTPWASRSGRWLPASSPAC